jgi:ribosomal protein S18 acetylase RimI-like enzyme
VIVELVDGAATRELRRAVLRPAWPVGSVMPGDGVPGVVHLAARPAPGGPVVGAAVLFPAPYPLHPERPGAWQLRGMATEAGQRGQGVGSAVLAEAVRQVQARGGALVWCLAREEAIAFYARHGFEGEGDRFVHAETGIVHQHMWREPTAGSASS